MHEENTKKFTLSVPGAIVVAGLLIAVSIFATKSGVAPSNLTANTISAGNDTAVKVADVITTQVTEIIAKKNTVKVDPIVATDHISGNPDASLVLIEYSDTECPYCKRFHTTLTDLQKSYDFAWVYRHYPIPSLHAKATTEALATECAFAQGGNTAFWNYINEMYRITPSNDGLPSDALTSIATTVGLDATLLSACIDAQTYSVDIEADVASGERAGASGTPYSVVVFNGATYPVEGARSIEVMKALFEALTK